MSKISSILIMLSLSITTSANASQYNMSLQDKTVTAYNGALVHPVAANVDKIAQIDKKAVTKISTGVYRIAGWGLANTIAVKGSKGWVIVDAGDTLEAATEQRQMLEAKVGEITVSGVVYTHSHYVWGAKAWQDDDTIFYAHEELMNTLRGDQGVSVLSGNFLARAATQFGMFHPEQGPDAFPNHFGFSAAKLTGTKAFVPPSITFKDEVVETHTIGGLTVEVLPSKTDVIESVAYYFPEKKLLVSNALNAGTMFNLYTLRGDLYRDPMDYVAAADLALTRDIEFHVDIHGDAKIGKAQIIAGIQEARDQMQLIHDQTYRAIALGKDAQGAAEWVYMPTELREGKEAYGQMESHVKRVYGARIGWMGWDIAAINPLSKANFSNKIIESMGGFNAVLDAVKAANANNNLKSWQWALYLTSELLIADATNTEVKLARAEAARALGQRTSSANARGWYITEAMLHEGKLKFGDHTISHMQQASQAAGAITPKKLADSPLNNNVHYLRYLVDPRLAEGKRAQFNVNFKDKGLSYTIALRNGVIAIIDKTNSDKTNSDKTNSDKAFDMTKKQWSQLILGAKSFASIDPALKAFDQAIGR